MIRAFSPGSVTLFFEIRDKSEDPLKRGSRGVGVCISEGMWTEIEPGEQLKVYLNGKRLKNSIQELVARKMGFVGKIESKTTLPVSQGFGTSASAALSTALAIAKLNGATYLKAAQIAHVAEIEKKSGLGDVASQYEGGFTVRLKEGIQPYGLVDRLFYPDGPLTLVILEGSIETESVIGNPEMRKKIIKEGHIAMERFLQAPTFRNAIRLAREFALKTSLISEEGRNLLSECENATVAMIGNSAIVLGECNALEDYKTIKVKIGDRAKIVN